MLAVVALLYVRLDRLVQFELHSNFGQHIGRCCICVLIGYRLCRLSVVWTTKTMVACPLVAVVCAVRLLVPFERHPGNYAYTSFTRQSYEQS